ncbi:MAG: cation diffusion facilitator family transporter [Clostridia bacterium]|nr:cation diffusion facilitator family transporter [Clostridia bacterium]
MTRNRSVLPIFAFGLAFNLVLFGVKLYVGLSSNSICIWSDAINNLFDALSCLLSFFCMMAAQSAGRGGAVRVQTKAEQLLSFVLAVIVVLVGAGFAYHSLERLMYPTPVWFAMNYFYIILMTALAKLALYFFYRLINKRRGHAVLRVMQTDSLLDCFITTGTLISFTLTRYLSFAVDAIFGLVISVVIVIQAVRMIVSSVRTVLDVVPKKDRELIENCISSHKGIEKIEEIHYYIEENNEACAYVRVRFADGADARAITDALKTACLDAGVRLCFIQ